ncbi:hypothetical protein BAE29_02190 [Acidithiobacillus caldus]|uniref:Uncharacterized protein n=1 Tax=Acidithiobacillus caldus TaxID=33059 RepID=A0A1E7YQV5_9PROT|nr:hypothetical protein BAE27_01495 [Acidithiobacillus caldus]OFC41655.1 hypothetical protein BAE29_02190 [Acidithiobacillus caldus]
MIYVSTSREYLKTFDALKKLLNRDGEELKFFNNFLLDERFLDSTILDTKYKLKFISKNQYKRTKDLGVVLESFDDNDLSLEVKFRNIGSLIVVIRNRFFHFKTGGWQHNIKLTDIGNTDEYFEIFNESFASFLSIIVLRSISYRYS